MKPLPQRMSGRQALHLDDHLRVPPQVQIGVEAHLYGLQP